MSDPFEGMGYEQARAGLDEVLEQLDDPSLPLDSMLELWERGEALATVCEARLTGARQRLDEVIAARTEGPPEGEPGPQGT